MAAARLPAEPILVGAFQQRLREIATFFQKEDRVHQAMRRVAAVLEGAQIPYAIVGGMAVNAHHHERTTKEVDFLLTAQGLAFLRQHVAQDFDPVPGRPRRFVDRATGVTFDVLVTGLFPGSGEPGPIAYPDPAAVGERIDDLLVIDLMNLVQLKLAARRHQDFADVVNLIRANRLEEPFQDKLHPSVRADYLECLEAMRREDEYEVRQDRAFQEKVREDDDRPEEKPGQPQHESPEGD